MHIPLERVTVRVNITVCAGRCRLYIACTERVFTSNGVAKCSVLYTFRRRIPPIVIRVPYYEDKIPTPMDADSDGATV